VLRARGHVDVAARHVYVRLVLVVFVAHGDLDPRRLGEFVAQALCQTLAFAVDYIGVRCVSEVHAERHEASIPSYFTSARARSKCRTSAASDTAALRPEVDGAR